MGQFKEFDASAETWDRFILRLQDYFLVENIPDNAENAARRKAILRQSMGVKLFNRYLDTVGVAAAAIHSFDQTAAAVKGMIQPAPLEIAERFQFARRRQFKSESPSDYMAALRQMSLTCNFANDADGIEAKRLRDQFVFGLASEEAQRYLLQQANLTVDTVVQLSEQFERARTTATLFQGKIETNEINQNSTGKSKKTSAAVGTQRFGPCSHCGEHHDATICKFKDARCHQCGKSGHIRKVCRSKPGAESKASGGSRHGKQTSKVKAVADEDELSDDEESNYVNQIHGSSPKYCVDIRSNGKRITLELDTGSGSTILSRRDWERIGSPTLRMAKKSFQSYSGHELPVLGCGRLDIEVLPIDPKSKKKIYPARYSAGTRLLYYVVDNAKMSLLGRRWIDLLGIKLGLCRRVDAINMVNTSDSSSLGGNLKDLLSEYGDLFNDELGKIKGVKASVTMNPAVMVRKFWPVRPVPFAVEKKVDLELDRLEKRGILERVPRDLSEYASPIVVVAKRGSEAVRICADFKVSVNKGLLVEQYPLPRTEDLFAKLAGSKYFTTLDLSEAFHQIELDEEAKKVLVIHTKKGLYRYNRLPFGIASAPAIFQRTMESILRGLPGTVGFIDDILVASRTPEEHVLRLRAVFERCREYGLRLSLKKCKFGMPSVKYLGHVVDERGIHTSEEKVTAILNAPAPKNVSEIKAFCGLVNYHGKFIPSLSTIIEPLNALTKKDVPWRWTSVEERAFRSVKEKLTKPPVLCYFDPKTPVGLAVDASAYGVGATLFHIFPNGDEKPIAYASRTLNEAQRNYAQIEKEAYAIIFGVSKFRQYLYGRQFTLVTDHKPLLTILSPEKSVPDRTSSRLQRWALTLQGYRYEIKYKSTRDHANADGLSRLPLPTTSAADDIDIFDIDDLGSESQLSNQKLVSATRNDKVLCRVIQAIRNGWPHEISPELEPFKRDSDNLSIQNSCVYRGQRAVIPKALQQEVLDELHQGHLGASKMKSLARSLVWWPHLDKSIEAMVGKCPHCQSTRPDAPTAAVHPWEFPERAWDRLHVDFAGPVHGLYWLVIVDARTKWPEVFEMKSATAWHTVKKLMDVIARFGVPSQIVSDNGPQFTSEEFQKFCQRFNIQHVRSSPFHPRSNGEAERFVRTFKNVLGSEDQSLVRITYRITRFLLAYRNANHSTTGQPPAEMMFGRRVRLPLDALHLQPEAKVRVSQERQASKGVDPRQFRSGDAVWARNYQGSIRWTPATILQRTAPLTYRIETTTGKLWQRHIDQLLRRDIGCPTALFEDTPILVVPPAPPVPPPPAAEGPPVLEPPTIPAPPPVPEAAPPSPVINAPRRSSRPTRGKAPQRFGFEGK